MITTPKLSGISACVIVSAVVFDFVSFILGDWSMAEQPKDDAENPEGKKKSKLKLIILIVVGLLVVGGGGAGAAFFFLSGSDSAETAEPVAKGPQPAIYTKIRTTGGKPMFVVTLQDEGGKRGHYLQTYVEAKSRDQAVADALALHMPLVVARLNNLFATQRFSELRTLEGKQLLRAKSTELLQEILMEKLGKPGIETILFTNFVMQ